ncbi:Uncharacterised protein [Raoultella terrigena]|uniref:Uncharacterized protein n=1 Tax=Raoultella terrigena TaxID=577 RepID=A0A485B1D1_RAOTE|nr:Uncharacterised protein [Raoultella terrigena]
MTTTTSGNCLRLTRTGRISAYLQAINVHLLMVNRSHIELYRGWPLLSVAAVLTCRVAAMPGRDSIVSSPLRNVWRSRRCLLSEGRVSSAGGYVSSVRREVSSGRRSIRTTIKTEIKTNIKALPPGQTLVVFGCRLLFAGLCSVAPRQARHLLGSKGDSPRSNLETVTKS